MGGQVNTYNMYLDGEEIIHLTKGDISVSMGQDSVHNSISFSSVSEELYHKADPSFKEGEFRIELHVGSRIMYFLLEERSGSMKGDVSYWGRDITARESDPWSGTLSIELDEWKSAKELCESLPAFSVVNWTIQDWMLPDTFEASGNPISIIQSIVSEIGAIVRAQDDGSLLVRHPYPVRPVYLPFATAHVEYFPGSVVNMSYQDSVGEHYNIVTVECDTRDKKAPVVELEELSNRPIGMDSYVRVYWFEELPEVSHKSTIWDYATAGDIIKKEEGISEHEEVITFSDGKGSTKYPMYELIDITWIGKTSTLTYWQQYSTELTIGDDVNYKIATVKYRSRYFRYLVTNHYVEQLIAVWSIDSSFNWILKVITAPIAKDKNGVIVDKQGKDIVLNYLTDKTALVKCGENWIDKNKYNYITVTLSPPFNEDALDGRIAWIDADRLIAGNYHILKSDIVISGPKVVNNLQVIIWEV